MFDTWHTHMTNNDLVLYHGYVCVGCAKPSFHAPRMCVSTTGVRAITRSRLAPEW
jgi:hypothetical protein